MGAVKEADNESSKTIDDSNDADNADNTNDDIEKDTDSQHEKNERTITDVQTFKFKRMISPTGIIFCLLIIFFIIFFIWNKYK